MPLRTAAKALALGADPARVARCMGILAEKTGIYGMIGGQTVDVELTDQSIPEDKLDFIYRLKTGALLEASFMIGAVLAGAGEEEVKTVEEIASLVGLAFQIQDGHPGCDQQRGGAGETGPQRREEPTRPPT